MKNVTGNTKFWKTVVHFFSDKTNWPMEFRLKKNDKILSADHNVAETLS